MRKKLIAGSCGILLCLLFSQLASADHDRDRGRKLEARLTGFQEVPANSTAAKGTFSMTIASDNSQFEYELNFSDLEAPVTQSHIHFAQPGVAGGIMIWLCGTAALPGPTGTPACPSPGGKVTGVVNASQVIGPAGQGVAAGEFVEALTAIKRGVAYANVHSTKFPSGEIRGQIHDD